MLGDAGGLRALFRTGGAPEVEVVTHQGTASFPSLETWICADAKGWTAADQIDDAGYARLLDAAERELGAFVLPDGRVSFRMPGHIVIAVKAAGGA